MVIVWLLVIIGHCSCNQQVVGLWLVLRGGGLNSFSFQVHSVDGEGYGEGNLGMEGIETFKASHPQCNYICEACTCGCGCVLCIWCEVLVVM